LLLVDLQAAAARFSRRSRSSRARSVLTIACCLLAIVSSLGTISAGVLTGRTATRAKLPEVPPGQDLTPVRGRGFAIAGVG
jgi:hypothetical protein